MKVLNVIHYPVFGGPHNEVLRSASPLGRRGWDSITVLPDEPGSGAERLRAAGLDVVQLPLHRLRAKRDPVPHLGLALTFLPEVLHIGQLIKRLDPDLVRVMGLVNPHGGLATRLAGRPVVWQVVDTRLPPLVRRVATSIARPLADAFLFDGQAVADLHNANRFSQPSFTYFPPVDTTLFSPSPDRRLHTRLALGIPLDAHVMGTVSNLSPHKGLEYFIEAAARVHVQVDNVWFLVVGASYASHRGYLARIKRQIAESVLPPERVIFTGAVPDPEQYYPAMDVKLITSPPRSEGTTTTALEAFACGVPVISTDVGAVAEVVDAGRNGLLVPPLDAAAIADATAVLLTDKDRLASMSRCARRSALERFAVERYCDVVIEACEAARDHHGARQTRTWAVSTPVATNAGYAHGKGHGPVRERSIVQPARAQIMTHAAGRLRIARPLLPRTKRPRRILTGPLRGCKLVTSWYEYPAGLLGYTESALLRWLSATVRPGQTWLDVGAHYGYTALALARLVGPSGRVFAFEPLPATVDCLRETRRLNQIDHLRVVPFGLAEPDNAGHMDVAVERGMANPLNEAASDVSAVTMACLDKVWDDLSEGDA
ncbi:MAG: FkbM family methyltransferase, partial [Acidimicrobiaceae bacterium]|nr:FkbM family methyltransferase [Acidimicrobiaceae bacterium]